MTNPLVLQIARDLTYYMELTQGQEDTMSACLHTALGERGAAIVPDWRPIHEAPTEPGAKIELFVKDGREVFDPGEFEPRLDSIFCRMDLHCFAIITSKGLWVFSDEAANVKPMATYRLAQAGALWRPLMPPPKEKS